MNVVGKVSEIEGSPGRETGVAEICGEIEMRCGYSRCFFEVWS